MASGQGTEAIYVFGATMPDGRCVGLTRTPVADDVMACAAAVAR